MCVGNAAMAMYNLFGTQNSLSTSNKLQNLESNWRYFKRNEHSNMYDCGDLCTKLMVFTNEMVIFCNRHVHDLCNLVLFIICLLICETFPFLMVKQNLKIQRYQSTNYFCNFLPCD